MGTYPDLVSEIAAFLQVGTSSLTVNGVDLGLKAVNRAHQRAQMIYDFEFAKVPVTVQVNLSSGGVLSPATASDGSTLVTVKKVLLPWTVDGSGNRARPIHFEQRANMGSETVRAWANRPWDYRFADPPLGYYSGWVGSSLRPSLVQVGDTLFLYPTDQGTWGSSATVINLSLDVVRWFPDYIGDNTDNDFLLQFGDEYLMWQSVLFLNKRFKEFVPEQQGNLLDKDIQAHRDQSWADLLAWDSGLVNSATDSLTLD